MDLFNDNINLVKKIVHKMNYGYCSVDDLMQAGLMGLFYASKNFDATLGVKFNTYATYYIIGEIKKELRNNNLIKLNREMYRIIRYLREHKDKSQEISLDLLEKDLKTSKENIILAYSYQNGILSLDKAQGEDDGLSPLEIIQESQNSNRYKKVTDALESLENDEKELIKLRYFNNYTQVEVASLLKKNQSKVSRLEKKALNNLRRIINI